MENQLDRLFQEWRQLGGVVLLDSLDPAIPARAPEETLAESVACCRQSGRLTWVVLDWLISHIDRIDASRLLSLIQSRDELSALGLLCDAARARRGHATFDAIIQRCVPHTPLEPFFERVAASPLASRLAAEESLPLFRRWGYLSNELRYLADERVPSPAVSHP